MPDRRDSEAHDRRRQSRSGRRAGDPHSFWRWRRLAWVFAAFAAYFSMRALPQRIRKLFDRDRVFTP